MRPKIGLALGGGGARGLAHIGVLKILEKAKVPIDIIVGTSMGAIIGAAYALEPNADLLEERVMSLLKNKNLSKLESLAAEDEPTEKRLIIEQLATYVTDLYLWNLRAIKGRIVENSQIEDIIKELVNEKSFHETKIKYACVATDINKGEEVIFDKGRLYKAVLASSAIPGVFSPVNLEGKVLIDGGIVTLLPAQPARKLGADVVIGVNTDKDIQPKDFKHGYDIIFQADDIRRHELNLMKKRFADIIIEPDIRTLSWAHFSKGETIVSKGEEATKKMLPLILKTIKKKIFKSTFKKFFYHR